jgi:hypothetical protein
MTLRLPNALSLLILAAAAMNYFAPFGDLDWTWQIRTGEAIVQERSLHVVDQFTYTIAGQPLPDHEWLYEVALFGVWNAFGIGGLKFLRVLLVLTPLWIVLSRLRRENVPWHGVVLLFLSFVFVLAPGWNLRPMYCTTIGLVLVSGWLHEHCTGRRVLPWQLPLVMLVWANVHPGVIAGQGLLAGAIGWELINARLKWNMPLDRSRLMRLTVIGGLGLVATFVCPDPLARFQYAVSPHLSHPIQQTFVEMQPTWKSLLRPPFNYAPIYLMAAVVLVTVVFRLRQYRLWELAFLGVLTILGNVASRGAMDWYLNLVALGVPHVVAMWRQALLDPRRRWVRRGLAIDNFAKRIIKSPLFAWQPRAIGVAALGLFLVSVVPPISRMMPKRDSHEWPVAALDALESQGRGGNFFGPPDYATYVNWRLKDRSRGYADTRGFYFPPVLLEDAHYLPQLLPGWRERMDRVLTKYPTDYFLLETTGPRGALWTALQPHVETPVYLDGQCVVLSAAQVRSAATAVDRQFAARPFRGEP